MPYLAGVFVATAWHLEVTEIEKGRKGQAEAIDKVYGDYPMLTDDQFLEEHLEWMKAEVGIKK